MIEMILKKEWLDYFKLANRLKPLDGLSEKELNEQADINLDLMSLLVKMEENCDDDPNTSFKKEDYIEYLDFIEKEEYGKLTNYTLI